MLARMPEPRPDALLRLPTYLAGHAARIGHRIVGDLVAKYDLRLPHFAVLTGLAEFGPLAQYELADRLALNRSHLVRYLDELQGKAYTEREFDPDDRRRHLVTLTPAGRSTQRLLMVEIVDAQNDFLAPLSTSERSTLVSLLTKIMAAESP